MTISRAAIILALAAGAITAKAQLTFTQLAPVVPGTGASALGMSGNGVVVVGNSGRGVIGGSLAAKWLGAAPQNLGTIAGYQTSIAISASADGAVIIGTCNETPSSFAPYRATRWIGSTAQDLGVLPDGFGTRAWAVSGDGEVVVGVCLMNNFGVVAFRWSQATGMLPLGTYNGVDVASVFAISGDGAVIVGGLTTPPVAFRWTNESGFQELGNLVLNGNSSALGVSSDGNVVVGSASSASGVRAFRWTSATGMDSLGVLPGAADSIARDTNSDGSIVVGRSYTPGTGDRAFIWTAGTGMLSLTDFVTSRISGLDGLILGSAEGISDDGTTVVGGAVLNGIPFGYRIDGISFESPCPECAADFDANGGVDGGDLAAFIVELETGAQCADIDQNGGVDGGDLGAFFVLYEAGGC